MKKKLREKSPEKIWGEFKDSHNITEEQLEKFKKYEEMLSEWNRVMNLTSIVNLSQIVNRHFVDSIAVRDFVDVSKTGLVVDIGSGAGFPGIPLKIIFPDLDVILIEVRNKRQKFLRHVIEELQLEGIEICSLDWRTFLRKVDCKPDFFLTRASIDTVELCRMFKPGSAYKNSKLIYWASDEWEPEPAVEKFIKKVFDYKVKRKNRKLVLMEL